MSTYIHVLLPRERLLSDARHRGGEERPDGYALSCIVLNSSRLRPSASSVCSHFGIRPRPDQVSPPGPRYLAASGCPASLRFLRPCPPCPEPAGGGLAGPGNTASSVRPSSASLARVSASTVFFASSSFSSRLASAASRSAVSSTTVMLSRSTAG